MRLNYVILTGLLLMMTGIVNAQNGSGAESAPTPDETLAWLKKLDENYDRPRFQTLTTERLKTLTAITLGGHTKDGGHVRIAPEEFRYLLPLVSLQRANLGEIEGLGDEALVYIGQLTSLTHLHLHDGAITAEGLKHLTNLQNLELLILGANRELNDAGMAALANLKSLKDLRISYTQVGDDGLKMLQQLPRLEALWIIHTNVTDKGIGYLSEIKTLKRLYINLWDKNERVTEQALATLKQALPDLEVDSQPQLQPEKDDVALEGAWLYDDLDAGYAEAKRTGKPMLVVFR